VGVLERDRRLARERDDDAFRLLVEHPGVGMAEEQPAEHLAGAARDRHREIARHRQMPDRRSMMWAVVAVAGILADVRHPYDALTGERRGEDRRVPRRAEVLEGRARSAGQRVQQIVPPPDR
jgi:hypothetical protein